MRVAVIGAGRMGGMHAQLAGGLDGVSEVLVCDLDADRAAAVARNAGGRAVTTDVALDEADAIVIATPAELHEHTLGAAIDRGLPVMCEKPLTHDLASSLAMVDRVEASGAHVQVGFQRRHDPGFVAAREALADPPTGRLQLVRLTAFDPLVAPRPPAAREAHDAAPIFLHSSVHDFDFVRWMSGQEVVDVSVDGSEHGGERPVDPRGLETAVVTMRLDGGTLAILEATWLHPSGYDIRVELVADGAHLTAGLSERTPAAHLDWCGRAADPWSGYLQRFETAYRRELEAFLAAVRGERPPASTARDGLEAVRIAIAATRSYAEGRRVALVEVPGARGREAA